MLRCVCKNWRCFYIKNLWCVSLRISSAFAKMIQKNWWCVLQQNDNAFTKKLRCVFNKRIYSAIIRKIYGAFTKKSYGAFTKRTMLFWRKNLDATCPMETMFVRQCFQTYGLGVCSYILRLLRNIWCVCKNDNAFTK